MKRLFIAVLIVILGSAVAASATAKSAMTTIVVTASAADTTIDLNGDRSEYRLLWNRQIRSTPIGHAFVHCDSMGRLGGGGPYAYCHSTYVFPLGKIVTEGPRRNRRRSTYVIVGGTRRYLDATGTLDVSAHGPGQLHLVFKLAS